MGRPPLRKSGAYSPAERQRRRRKRLHRARSAELKRKHRRRAWDKRVDQYVPFPPGITHWRVVILPNHATMMQPETRPLAQLANDLEDDEVRSLLEQITKLARERGLL